MNTDRMRYTFFVSTAITLAIVLMGCANPIKSARISLATVARLQTEAVNTFKEYDANRQLDIVKTATSADAAKAALAAWRAERKPVVQALQGLYLVSVAAEKSIALAEQGVDRKISMASVVKEVFDAFDKVKTTLMALGIPHGGIQ